MKILKYNRVDRRHNTMKLSSRVIRAGADRDVGPRTHAHAHTITLTSKNSLKAESQNTFTVFV